MPMTMIFPFFIQCRMFVLGRKNGRQQPLLPLFQINGVQLLSIDCFIQSYHQASSICVYGGVILIGLFQCSVVPVAERLSVNICFLLAILKYWLVKLPFQCSMLICALFLFRKILCLLVVVNLTSVLFNHIVDWLCHSMSSFLFGFDQSSSSS